MVTEQYLRDNYSRYVENCQEDGGTPQLYEEWRKWFIDTFKVLVSAQQSCCNWHNRDSSEGEVESV